MSGIGQPYEVIDVTHAGYTAGDRLIANKSQAGDCVESWRVGNGLMRTEVESPGNSPPACADLAEEPAKNVAPVFGVLAALSFAHLLNDTMQSLIPAIYPILKSALRLDFRHIGLITLTNQLTASILQPFVGLYTDKHPQPFSLAIGMAFTLVGLALLAVAGNLGLVLLAVAFVGIGSSVFHPEASRVAHLSSGGRHGFAQSLFQVGTTTNACRSTPATFQCIKSAPCPVEASSRKAVTPMRNKAFLATT